MTFNLIIINDYQSIFFSLCGRNYLTNKGSVCHDRGKNIAWLTLGSFQFDVNVIKDLKQHRHKQSEKVEFLHLSWIARESEGCISVLCDVGL